MCNATGWRKVIALSLLALAGCSAEPDTGAAYLDALSRALDRDIVAEPVSLGRPVQRRDLRLAVPDMSIDVVEFARLHACDMGALIGARNSALGQVQTESAALVYELRWIERARRCEDVDFLPALLERKEALLPVYIWNAIFAGPEFVAALGARAPDAAQAAAAPIEPLQSLAALVPKLLRGELPGAALEAHLKALRQVRLGARRASWARVRTVLDAASAALDTREPPVCLSGEPNARSERLAGVLRRYYVADWQAPLAAQMRDDVEWLAALQRLLAPLRAVAPPDVLMWLDSVYGLETPHSEWQQTRAALVAHAGAWEALYVSCGMQVGGAPSVARPSVEKI